VRLCYAHLGGKPFVALAHGENWINLNLAARDLPARFSWLASCPEPTLVDWLRNAPDFAASLTELVRYLTETGGLRLYLVRGELRLLPPVPNPSKIIALGRNYAAHAAEHGHGVPEEPIFFAKAPSSIIGPGEDVLYPDFVHRLDPEIELAVVIGRRTKAVSEDKAMACVAGYTVLNDVTARDMQKKAQEQKYPWFASKSLDTFCPMGPHLVLVDEIPDPHDLELTLRVNGQVRQHSRTSMMVFKIPHLIAFISKHMTLEPGDIIATGTPEGTAPVQRGDILECSITRLGTLTNRVM